jgi:uncharacterized protein YdhG (YjbR/CyaY superfamily)
METKKIATKTIDEHIAQFPESTREILQKVRETIREVAPYATESIAYGIPTFRLNGNLVHFAGYARHVGFYPGSEAIEVFREEIKGYKTSRGTIQFPLNKPIPYELIKKITLYRVLKNQKSPEKNK